MKVDLKLSSEEMMDVLEAIEDEAFQNDYDIDNPAVMRELFGIVDVALKALGIEIVPADRVEDDDEEPNEMEFDCEGDCANCPDPCPEYTGEEEEEEEPDNPVARCVFMCGGKRAIKESDADDIFEGAQEAVNKVFGVLPVEVRQKILSATLVKLFEENGIEVVLKGV